MKRMNKMLLVAALAATTLSAQAEQKKGPAWLSDALFYQIYPSIGHSASTSFKV